MDSLDSHGLLATGTRRDLVKNAVVLIVPKASRGISGFQDLARPEVKHIAIGEPQTVPAGKYAQEVLTHFSLYEQLKTKYVLAKDVRQVLTYVVTGNVDAGIVYATDAQTSAEVKVVATAPEDSHSMVIYPAAVLKIPGPVECLCFFRRVSACSVPQPQQLGIESLVSFLLVLVELVE